MSVEGITGLKWKLLSVLIPRWSYLLQGFEEKWKIAKLESSVLKKNK